MTEQGDLRGESGNVAVWKDDCGSTMWKCECEHHFENFDKQSHTGAEKDCSISNSRGQLLQGSMWRGRCRKDSEATVGDESKARSGDDRERDTAKCLRHHGSVAALLKNSHRTTIANKPRTVTIAVCEALCKRSLVAGCGETQSWKLSR